MKKTIAVGSASLLGLTAVGFGASSAQAAADPVVAPCLTDADHVVSVGGVSSNWYMDCLPQYGTSEIGFWIQSGGAFPAGFVHLENPSVTSTATTGTAAVDYFGATGAPAGFADGPGFIIGDSTAQAYEGSLVLKINSLGSIPTASLPADCAVGAAGTSYTNAYEVTYLPATVTFSQLVDGVEWRYDVAVTPPPLYLGLSFAAANDGSFEPTGSMCAYGASGPNGQASWFAANNTDPDGNWDNVASLATQNIQNLDTLSPYFGAGKLLPDISRYVPPKPELASTGVDPSGALGVAALFLALGVAGGFLRRRKLARD